MTTDPMLGLLAGLVLGALVAAGVAWGLMMRRAKQARSRLHHVEQARQLAAQQLTQARKQIEALQKECHELRLHARPRHAEPPAEAPIDPAEAARRYLEEKLQEASTKPQAPEAFPDTQIIMRRST
jgi:hypothetical protein